MARYLKTKYPGIFKYEGPRGAVYGIDYYMGGKRHREIVGKLLDEARAKLEEMRARAKRGDYVSLSRQRKATFDELIAKYVETEKGRPSFDRSRKYFLFRENGEERVPGPIWEFFRGRRLATIGPYDLEEFKRRRMEALLPSGKSRSAASVNRELAILRHMFSKAVEWGMMAENPFKRFRRSIFLEERNDRCRYLTEDEIHRLLTACPPYLRNIVQGALLTGLRKGDLLDLRWADIDLERRILYYTEQKKGGKRGVKVLNNDLLELLQRIPQNGSEYIFTGPDGKPIKDCKRAFQSALRKADIEDFRFHDLRHTSASYLVMRGASMKAVQAHLGHTTVRMTERYSHLSPDFLRSEVEKLDGAFKWSEVGQKSLQNAYLEDTLLHSQIPVSG